jgi:hypothetical protein
LTQPGLRWTGDGVTDREAVGTGRRPRLLLLCDFRPHEAATVLDHVDAIRRWSRNDVFVLPIFGDLPDELNLDAFDGLAIHYNLVMANRAYLSPLARWRVSRFRGVKAAFIQDEYRFVNQTTSAMRTLGIQVLFTCVPEDQVDLVYPDEALPEVRRKVTVLTGYVPSRLLSLPVLPYDERPVDIAYRARRLPPWLGLLGQEKATIGDRFGADAPGYGLATDISSNEEDRLYGSAWTDFLGRSKAMLGVESGASIFDFDGSIERNVREAMATQPDISFEELHRRFLAEFDGRIRLNQISPRCFEAAALGTLMVLYPGDYSGVLEPWRHYVPLEKDHSNMDAVVGAIRDRETWERITTQARQEVALNPRNSFQAMVAAVDDGLGLQVTADQGIDAGAFEAIATRNFAAMPYQRMRAAGLPPAVNRIRFLAVRAALLPTPSPIAIPPLTDPAAERMQGPRAWVRYARAFSYWAMRPGVLPWSMLQEHRRALPRELSELGRLQAFGRRAFAAGADSPLVVVLDQRAGEVRIVLRTDLPADVTALAGFPDDIAWASAVSLDLTDPWLVPLGFEGLRSRSFGALSAVLRAHPDVARQLLVGRAPWCDVALLGDAEGGSRPGRVRPRRAVADGA